MKIDFYYWGYQCPIIYEMIKFLKSLKSSFYEIKLFDISNDFETAKRMKMFFPFLTVFDNTIRYRSPLFFAAEEIKKGIIPKEKPYIPKISFEKMEGNIKKLNSESIKEVLKCCTMTGCEEACEKKAEFLKGIEGDFFGYIHFQNNKIVGGVEFIPSTAVPYDIPKNSDTAFLSCLYNSSTEKDVRIYPLEKLEKELSKKYKEVIAITDEESVFPNGNLKWFIKNGYKDNGVISIEEGYAKLHLVSKTLKYEGG
jgi:hypothetical protein